MYRSYFILHAEYMFYLSELAITHGRCVAVEHEEFSEALADSHSSFEMPEVMPADFFIDELDALNDSTSSAHQVVMRPRNCVVLCFMPASDQ